LINRDHTSWFHFRFLGDPAILSSLSAAMLSLQFRRTGIEFWLHLANILAFAGLFVASLIIYLHKITEALEQRPGCYDERFKTFCEPFDAVVGVIIVLLLVPACVPGNFKLPHWLEVIGSVIISLIIITVIYLSFTDYEVMKVMLKSPETEAEAGQTLTLLTAVLALFYSLYKNFGMLSYLQSLSTATNSWSHSSCT
jgi:hypothetical protein